MDRVILERTNTNKRGRAERVCLAISLLGSEVPTDWVGARAIVRRSYGRAGREEYRFYAADPDARLPILRGGRFAVARWGNARGRSRSLPRTAWTTPDE